MKPDNENGYARWLLGSQVRARYADKLDTLAAMLHEADPTSEKFSNEFTKKYLTEAADGAGHDEL